MANSNEGLSDCPVSGDTIKKNGILVVCDSKHLVSVVGYLEIMCNLSLGDYCVIANPGSVSRMAPISPNNNHRLISIASTLAEFQNAMTEYNVKRIILFEAARGQMSGDACVDLINVAKMLAKRYGTIASVEAYRYDNSAGFCLIKIDQTRSSVIPTAHTATVG